jgi:hypothetical protein
MVVELFALADIVSEQSEDKMCYIYMISINLLIS